MSILRPLAACAVMTLPFGAAQADAPRVAVDIAPIYSLVAGVMGDLGTPSLMVDPGQSPHDSSLRPSKARALAQAELVIWMGPALTPWLQNSVEALAGEVGHIELLALDATHRLEPRSLEEIGSDDHDHDHGHDHGHDDHDGADPHAWLDPDNAAIWVAEIATALGRLDPANSATYAANAALMAARIQTLTADLDTVLRPHRTTPFLVQHDAYYYLENRFDLTAFGALTLSDASAPSAGDIAALRSALQAQEATCVFVERPEDQRLVNRLLDGTDITIAVADPLGGATAPSATSYFDMMRAMVGAISTCLADR